MSILPLKETINVYNRNQQCSRVEQLRDPAVVADYALNKGDFINKDILNVYSESEGVVAKQGLTVSIFNLFAPLIAITPGTGIYRNFIFSVNTGMTIDYSAMPNNSTWYVVLKIVEKRFTSGATSGGTETDDNALEGIPGTNPYGNLWPQASSGYDPNNCLQIVINTTAYDISNEWRYKYSFELVNAIPINENPIAGTSINMFFVSIATITKDASGNATLIDQIFTNSVAYRNRPNYFLNSNQMAPSPMNIIQKTQSIPSFGLVSNYLLSPSGNSDTYILNLDDTTKLGGYDPLTGFVLPGIDPINNLPFGGNGHRFKLIITSTNPSKRLLIQNQTVGSTRVTTSYPLVYQIPGSSALASISLAVGSITSFVIYNNLLYLEDGNNHITQNLYGDTNYTNTTFFSKYATHKAALEALEAAITFTGTSQSFTLATGYSTLNPGGSNTPLRYRKDANGNVIFKGILVVGSVGGNNQFGNVAAGYGPATPHIFPAISYDSVNGGMAVVIVNQGGSCQIVDIHGNVVTNGKSYYLDSVRYNVID